VTDNFFDVGGDSLAAVDILAGMETLVGHPVPLFTLIEHPTIEHLARIVGGGAANPTGDMMLHLTPRGGKTPLFFAASDFFMLQPPASGKIAGIDELATQYADRIADHGRACIVAGFSVGSIAALETARQLRARGFPVSRLCLVDAVYPGRILRSAIFWRSVGWLARRLNAHELTMNGRYLGALFSDSGLVAQIDAMAHYRVEPYDGATTMIRSTGLARWERWLFKPWRRVVELDTASPLVSGLHGSMFEAGNISELAAAIRA